MLGVVARPGAARQREIVARTLALGAQLLCGRPDERMEPVQCAGDAAECVADEIMSPYVGELVKQNRQAAIGGPVVAFGGKNDGGRDHAAGEWHSRVITPQESRRLIETESIGDFPQRREPFLRV